MQFQEFELLARRVMGVIVRPRVERLLAHIPDASLAEPSGLKWAIQGSNL